MKLALGTVQFGQTYGINNTVGQVPLQEVSKILDQSSKQGINILDTAAVYGESEAILGSLGVDSFKVVSKLPKCRTRDVNHYFKQSIKKLGAFSLYGYLFHDFNSYLENPEQHDILLKLRHQKKVKKIGFSLYNPEELQHLLDSSVDFDLLQIPFSILDRRFSSLLPELARKNIEVHTRSTFLQGVVFRNPQSLPENLKELESVIYQVQEIALSVNLSVFELALSFVIANSNISKVVIGVDTLKQLESNVKAASIVLAPSIVDAIYSIQVKNEKKLNPSNWN